MPDSQGGDGAGGGRQIIGVGLALHGGIQQNVQMRGERRGGAAQNADERRTEFAQQRHQRQQFAGRAVLGDQDRRVARRVDAQVAMHGLGGMQEHRGGTGAAQSGHDFARDMPALADAGDHHFPWMRQNQVHRTDQRAIQAGGGLRDGGGFDLHGGPRRGQPVLFHFCRKNLPTNMASMPDE